MWSRNLDTLRLLGIDICPRETQGITNLPCRGLIILLRPVIGTVQRRIHMIRVTCSLILGRIHIGQPMILTGLGPTHPSIVLRVHVRRPLLAAPYHQMTDIIPRLGFPRLRRTIARILSG